MKIAEARRKLGWSQAYLAMVTGYSQQGIGLIERNVVSPNVATLQDIANALGISFMIEPD